MIMAVTVFYERDVQNAIMAAEQATAAAAEAGELDPGYVRGYRAALLTLALAFGLRPGLEGGRSARDLFR